MAQEITTIDIDSNITITRLIDIIDIQRRKQQCFNWQERQLFWACILCNSNDYGETPGTLAILGAGEER